MLLSMKDEVESNLKDEENDFILYNSYGEETIEELTAAVMMMAQIQPADGNAKTVPSYDAKAVSEVNASSKVHEQVSHVKCKTIIQTSYDDQIDSNIIFGDPYVENNGSTPGHDSNAHDEYHEIQMLGYKNLERIKKAIATQPKMYDGERLHSAKLTIDSPNSEENLEDAEENRLKMRNKMVQINYGKLNALYETFVPQQEFSVEQTYFSIPSTSNNGSESKEITLDLPIPKMPKESKLLKMFDIMGVAINGLRTRIDKTLLEDRKRRWMSDSQNSLREFYETDVIPMSASLSKNLKELKELIEEVQLTLNIFVSMEQKVNGKSLKENILQNEIGRLLEVSLTTTRTQHKKELDKLIEHVNQKTYAYADVRAKNQDLLIIISKLKNKLQTVDKGKNVNTKFDKSETSRTLHCVTSLPKNIAVKAKKMSNTKVKTDRSKPVTSHLTPKNEQIRKHNENVLARGMYRITETETQTLDSKTNINVCNSTGVKSSNSVRRPKSKDTKLKDKVLKNNNDKRPSAHVRKMSSSVSIDSNKRETMHSNVCQSNASVLSTKTVNAINDGSNIVCVSCSKDVFLLSHEKYVSHYALSRNSSVKRALFTTPIATKSNNLGATSVVTKSRLSIAKTPTATNNVSSVLPLSSGSSQSRTLRTVHFGNDHFAAITGYGDYVQGNLTICHV
ncbi:hypothetical protein Tco_1118513 [Tanacetum coccineum]